MTQDSSAPIWRERVQLSHTIKDGWRVSEATLEITYPDRQEPLDRTRAERLNDVVVRGQKVVNSLNGITEGAE